MDGSRSPGGPGLPDKAPTPTASGIPLRSADFVTLTEALDYAATGRTGGNFYDGRGELMTVLPYSELRSRARDLARRLCQFERGSRIALVAHTHADFAVMFCACQYAALVPVPLPAAMHLGGRDAFIRYLHQLLGDCKAVAAFAPAEFIEFLHEAAFGLALQTTGTMDDFMALEAADELPAPPAPHELAYLQYTSGSTRFPRGTMITQAAALANLEDIFNNGFLLTQDDRFCSWLPFYHDMGLVGIVLGCIATQRSVDYLASRDFAMRPRLWLKLMSRNRGTVSFSPPFGYALCARRIRPSDAEGLDLSAWRIAGVGAEMIHPMWLEKFADALAPAGFDARSFLPCYGMAECCLAVSFSTVGAGAVIDRVDSESLALRGIAQAASSSDPTRKVNAFINCGVPLPGFEVEIRDAEGRPLPDRHCGRIHLRGASTMSGYFNNPEATRETLSADGWLDTGDLGYRVDGALHITGRVKDLLIINGRNIWPQDIEHLAEQQPELRPTDTSAFSVVGEDGSEVAVLVVQSREVDPAKLTALSDRLQQAIYAEFGIRCLIQLVPPHTLPHTSSGKLSRSTARNEFLRRHHGEDLFDPQGQRAGDGQGARVRALLATG